MKLTNWKRALFSLFFATQANYSCTWREPIPQGNEDSPDPENSIPDLEDACSYEPIQETEESRFARLGDINCTEAIPGHNDAYDLNRINIVFSGVNNTAEQFHEHVMNSVDCPRKNLGLLYHQVIADNASKFNFWYHDEPVNLIYSEGHFYSDENLENGVNLTAHAEEKASECNGTLTSLMNLAGVVIVEEDFRSTASVPPYAYYDIDKDNFKNLLNLEDLLERKGIDQSGCEKFVTICYLLDHNRDDAYSEEDLDIPLSYSPTEINRICNALHSPEECQHITRNETIEEFENLGREYGLELCRTLSQARYERPSYPPSSNPNYELCQVLVGENYDVLGAARVSNKGYVPMTVCHELGHVIWGLRDEYVQDNITNSYRENILDGIRLNGKNCFAGSYEDCLENSNWSHLAGTGCYEGCDLVESGVYRPTENNIMRNHIAAESYEPYGEERICKILSLLTGSADGKCDDYLGVE